MKYIKTFKMLIESGIAVTPFEIERPPINNYLSKNISEDNVLIFLNNNLNSQNINETTKSYGWEDGWTPLMYVIEKEYVKAVSLLINKGANVNQQTTNTDGFPIGGKTPLMLLANQPNTYELSKWIEIFELLVNNGADVHLTDYKGKSFVDFLYGDYKNYISKNKDYSYLINQKKYNL